MLKATTVYLPEDVHRALRMETFKRGISMTELIRVLVEDHLRKAGHELRSQTERIRPGPKRRAASKARK